MRVGIIGSNFGRRSMAPVFVAGGFEAVDVVSARDDAACAALAKSRVDVVSIHSPPFLHLRHVERVLEAGKAVLCDKPFGVSAHEAKTMTPNGARGGKPQRRQLRVSLRTDPIRQQLKALIDDGTIGQPEQLVWQNFSSRTRNPLRPFNWMFDRSPGGGGLRTWGSHAIDMAAWLFGPLVARDARLFARFACGTIATASLIP